MKRTWSAFTLLLLSATLLLIGCGGGNSNSGDGRDGVTPPTTVSINIAPGSRTITFGESVTLTVTAVGTNITWPTDITGYTQTGNTAVFTPTAPGTYNFTVTAAADATKKATAIITVNPVSTTINTPNIDIVTPTDYIPIDFSSDPDTNTTIWGLNESGMLSGRYTDASGTEHGALFTYDENTGSISDSVTITYNGVYASNLAATEVHKINNFGQLVGVAHILTGTGSQTRTYGFLHDSASVQDTTFENPNTSLRGGTTTYGINDSGKVAGTYIDSIKGTVGFLGESNGTTTPLDIAPAGSREIRFFDINEAGVIAGFYLDADNNMHGFTYANATGTITTIDYPDADNTSLCGINNAGYVVGFFTASGKTSGFVYDGIGTVTPFDYPGAKATYFTEINNTGQITGYYRDASDNYHGLLINDLVSIP